MYRIVMLLIHHLLFDCSINIHGTQLYRKTASFHCLCKFDGYIYSAMIRGSWFTLPLVTYKKSPLRHNEVLRAEHIVTGKVILIVMICVSAPLLSKE